MKTTILVVLSFLSVQMFAQDLITTLEGETIEVSIIEVNEKYVKYVEYNDPNGIKFTMSKSRLSNIEFVDFIPSEESFRTQSVISKEEGRSNRFVVNGRKGYTFEQLEEQLKKDDSAFHHFEVYKKKKALASGFGWTTIGLFGASLLALTDTPDGGDWFSVGQVLGILTIVFVVPTTGTMALIFYAQSKSNQKKAIEAYGISSTYSKGLFQPEIPQLKLGLVSSGIGVQITF